MARFLVVFRGDRSGEWLFIAVTAHRQDADMIAEVWRGRVFDLLDES